MLDIVVIFPAGASHGDRQCVNVTILQDDIVEGTEFFFLQASRINEALSLIIIDPSLTTVSIADSASECFHYLYCHYGDILFNYIAVVNFQIIFPGSVSEDIGSVDVCIEQMNGELNDAVEVRVWTSQTGTTATGSDQLV